MVLYVGTNFNLSLIPELTQQIKIKLKLCNFSFLKKSKSLLESLFAKQLFNKTFCSVFKKALMMVITK